MADTAALAKTLNDGYHLNQCCHEIKVLLRIAALDQTPNFPCKFPVYLESGRGSVVLSAVQQRRLDRSPRHGPPGWRCSTISVLVQKIQGERAPLNVVGTLPRSVTASIGKFGKVRGLEPAIAAMSRQHQRIFHAFIAAQIGPLGEDEIITRQREGDGA